MKITKENRKQPDGFILWSELTETDFVITARVDNDQDGTSVEYTIEIKAMYAANAIHAVIDLISSEQRVEPQYVIVSHVAMRSDMTGKMVTVL